MAQILKKLFELIWRFCAKDSSDMSDMQESLRGGCFSFKIFSQPAVVAHPSKSSFNHPTHMSNGDISFFGDWAFRYFDLYGVFVFERLLKDTTESAVSEHFSYFVQQRLGVKRHPPLAGQCRAVVAVGCPHLSPEQVAQSIGGDESLAAFEQFAAVNPNGLGATGSVFNALAVYYRHARAGRLAMQNPVLQAHLCADQIPCAVALPFLKIPVQRLPRRKIMGHVPPDNPVFAHIKNALHYALQRPLAFSAYFEKFFNPLPLVRAQIGRVFFHNQIWAYLA